MKTTKTTKKQEDFFIIYTNALLSGIVTQSAVFELLDVVNALRPSNITDEVIGQITELIREKRDYHREMFTAGALLNASIKGLNNE